MSDLAGRLIALTPRLRRHARGLVGDAARADDLVQDTLERAWRYRWRFQLRPRLGATGEGDGLFAWLLTIMHRLHLNAVRRPDRLEMTDAPPDIPVNDDPGLRRDLLRALASLPDDQRAVLLLVGLEQLAYREAADVLGVPLGTVMSRLSRARERMRVALDGAPAASGDSGTTLHRVK
ncbi:RNA polymerase sigma factor [Ralstonia syzygii subsp. celebesensis]|uniref:RNA polymerase sigma factor n=5 Tax=Ralstonia solanacearum species complex TaxID=3116862 RepID=A0AAD0S5D5_RALSL|nr:MULTISPECIES: RNA polymerase sigma factor [Ralstonia solanacearum species complex]CCA81323.1 putative RNA polymerase sigma factor [blood disease bacterium R229]BEU70838.1 RNA polymerase sigma factor [Ralstonia pseudosolanacearum]AMP36423.1 RNA polymerase subunit sigma-70 [Ralstonia solanacearum]AQW30698.1 RNA polymerase subunit sigma-70 [blood disease bacterium A2-HR MARDI]AXV75853.1 RNA polymerase sigma factor [Ralstonia solanacearum]